MDLPSDSDESDVDFVPGKEESLSEESETEADKETEAQYENEVIKKQSKRAKRSSQNSKRKRMKPLDNEDSAGDKTQIKEKPVDPVLEKKHEDDLWASFLGPEDSKSKSKKVELEKPKSIGHKSLDDIFQNIPDKKPSGSTDNSNNSEDVPKEQKVVTKSMNKMDTNFSPSGSARSQMPVKTGGGLSSILSKIGKKDKVSTLEKSKLDWNSFKKNEGIEEEIVTHNRGRDGYLERQDFLQRTDLRQFEIEKDLRTTKRSNR